VNDAVPDHQLLQQIAGGDADAFTALFRRRRADIYRFALHMIGSVATAEDVTQEVFLSVMRDAGRYDPARATVPAWLCGIARNHVLRRLERDRFLQPLDSDTASRAADAPDPLSALAHAERINAVRSAVMSLPVRYREAVVLCDLQELSYADAAAALECAIGTVRSRLHRGRTLLAAKLRDQRGAASVKLRHSRCFA
jgi:RNA polymerase sigma-70 factor (ECF subfamily)